MTPLKMQHYSIFPGYYYHLRDFDEQDYDGVYLQENVILINNRPIYQKIVLIGYERFDDKCIWWDAASRRWFLGLCEDLGTSKS